MPVFFIKRNKSMNSDLNSTPQSEQAQNQVVQTESESVLVNQKADSKQQNTSKKKLMPVIIGLFVLLILISGGIAVYSLVTSPEPVGDIRQQASTGEIAKTPTQVSTKAEQTEPGEEIVDFSKINYQVNKSADNSGCLDYETKRTVEYCEIGYWNVIPPKIETPEELQKLIKQEMENLKASVEADGSFEKKCNDTGATLETNHPDIFSYYRKETLCGDYFFNDLNNHIRKAVIDAELNQYMIFENYDGEYTNDDISENDKTYIMSYFLLKRTE